ncbi:MAG: peptidylprolyl isomerase [Ectothiorhodospiraceae bacterium]|nr:peptidylprolyl isomerase [Ectothiorhodospiraceae bacterium]MCH8503566.1 peptidylprolyl isomerase [Ectothiorhodospiraceae bacterium]
MKRYLLSVIVLSLLLGCGPDQEPERPETSANNPGQHASDDTPIATVNGDVITESMLELHAMRRTGDSARMLASEHREMLLLELVEMALIAQDAHERALDEDRMLQAQMQNIQRALMAQALLEELKRDPVPEAELTALYQQHFAEHREEEYHARHILVDEEAQARQLIEALEGGADFADLARQYSQGPYGPQGGDLGWFTMEQTVEPFGQATAELDVGDHTRDPVRTQFGWHVILLEDKRVREPPSKEEVRDRLEKIALKRRIQQHVSGLREQGDVRLYLPED